MDGGGGGMVGRAVVIIITVIRVRSGMNQRS